MYLADHFLGGSTTWNLHYVPQHTSAMVYVPEYLNLGEPA